jgi:hypothetical protein
VSRRLLDLARRREDLAIEAFERNLARAAIPNHAQSSDVDYSRIQVEQSLEDLQAARRLADYAEIRVDRLPGDVYAAGGFFADLVRAPDDPMARRRLAERNSRAEDHYQAEHRAGDPFGGLLMPGYSEVRASSSGSFGALSPAGAALGAAGGLARSAAPLVNALLADGAEAELPPTGSTFTYSMGTTQGVVGVSQTSENSAVTPSDVTFIDSTSPVRTIVASVLVSRQSFERAPARTDAFVRAELGRAIESETERQVIDGSGSSGELTGLLRSAGISVVTNTVASQTQVGRSVLQAMRLGADARKAPTKVVCWAPRRFYWMGTQRSDVSLLDDVFFELAEQGWVTNVLSGGGPVTAGTSADQDRILALNGSDVALALDAPRVYVDTNSQASPGSVRIVSYRYAGLGLRYASAVSAVSGMALISPPAF